MKLIYLNKTPWIDMSPKNSFPSNVRAVCQTPVLTADTTWSLTRSSPSVTAFLQMWHVRSVKCCVTLLKVSCIIGTTLANVVRLVAVKSQINAFIKCLEAFLPMYSLHKFIRIIKLKNYVFVCYCRGGFWWIRWKRVYLLK